MKLSVIVVIISTFLLYSCNNTESNKQVNSSSIEDTQAQNLLEHRFEDGRTIKVKSYSLEKGEAEEEIIKQGVKHIFDKMTDLYLTQIKMNSTAPLDGTCLYTFRIEPNGMFRMIQEGHRTLVEENFAPLKESFLVSAMAHDFKFPASESQLVVKIEFEFNKS